MYDWRKMTAEEKIETLTKRKESGRPWHGPPFRDSGESTYLITSACFEHRSVIGYSRERIGDFARNLLTSLSDACPSRNVHSWVVLPNHYHVLCDISNVAAAKRTLGGLHGRTSFEWNRQEDCPGRKVWFRALETKIKNERHYWSTVNYIHRNPLKHQCVSDLKEWPWSSFAEWMEGMGRESLAALWKAYPTERFGERWDEGDLSIEGKSLLE